MRLERSFYTRADVVQIAKDLLGKVICTQKDGVLTSGMITETEAYSGRNDKACHANNDRRTTRTEIMYGNGGHAYVYLCYGMHYLTNVVTNRNGLADAVLIRSVHPIDGKGIMVMRRNSSKNIADGPGKLSQALGIDKSHYGADLLRNSIWIEERGFHIPPGRIKVSQRIGVGYAMEDAEKEWRFYLENK